MQIQKTNTLSFKKYNFKGILTIFLVSIFLFSCQNPANQNAENKSLDTTESFYPELDKTATIFTVPSPMQIATTLKIIDLPYKTDILDESFKTKDIYASKYYQSLNLGLNIIDLGYAVLYDKNSKAVNFLSKIEKITHELGIQDQKTLNKINEIRDNLYNKDSVSHFILSAQNSITNYYQNSDDQEIGIWIISSLYIEGLFILTDNYNDLIKKGEISELQTKHLNILLLHQKLFLPNLCELYNILEINNKVSIYNHLENLKADFENLNISFKYDENLQKLKEVKLDNKKISAMNEKLKLIRREILSCKAPKQN